jgi:hypothetical protein
MWKNLTDNQKIEYRIFCDNYLGKSITFSSSGEPLYFTENANIYKFKDIFQGIRRFKLEKIKSNNEI